MSDLQLFVAGVAVAIPAAASIAALVFAAIADGRENDRLRALEANRMATASSAGALGDDEDDA